MSKEVLFHVKHSPSGKPAKEYGVVHVQIDFENQATWFVLAGKDGNFSTVPAKVCKKVNK